ncbi:MAG: Dna2/Cas4 domain-containing protein [Paracoccaceae bacterium]|nr:Dna2/Cas4 domain-containing protein [Paracoccaceae bacterium]
MTVEPVVPISAIEHFEQACAQALCLEEMLGVDTPHGFVWYGGLKRRVRVEFTRNLRDRFSTQ